jgi:uncharacterized protein YecE (DUF72 family)
MSEIRVGTSGWNYPGGRGTWNGVFYPARRPRGFDELAYYAQRFDTVEVNSTFYRMPEAPMSEGWVSRTPPGFLFSVKLYQKFTHPDMYLARSRASDWDLSRSDVDLFRIGVEPIAASGKLAAILIQFPPSFHAEPDTFEYLDWLLDGLTPLPMAVELRHRTWSDDPASTLSILDAHHASWVLIDEPKFPDSIRQELAPGTPGRAPVYVRLHGRNAAAWWEHESSEDRYDYLYAAGDLKPFAAVARQASAAGRRVLMYLNNHFSAKSVANAALLKHELGQELPGDYPGEIVGRYPELAGVVVTSGLPL